MPAISVSGEVRSIEMIFGAASIGLRTACCKKSGDRDPSVRKGTGDLRIVVSHEKPGLIQPMRRELVQIADIDLVFQEPRVGPGTRKRRSADGGIVAGAMFIRIADPELVSIGEIMKKAAGTKKLMCGSRHRLRDRAESKRLRGSNGAGIDDRLLIQEVLVERQQETGALAVCDGSGYRAFVILPALRRLNDSEGVARVEDRIAKHAIQRAVVLRRSTLGD